MSNEKRKKLASTNSLLPSINYKQSISLVLLLLVTFTSPSIQTPLTHYDCPSGCVCDETQLSAKCDNIDALIESYSIKAHHHTAQKNFMPIKSLDLSNNELTKIFNQLELLANLTELNLSFNKLTQVHKLNFEHLETLDLSHNHITSAKLSKLPKNVVHLKLSHNEITYLPSDFMKLKKLRSLELTGNPLNCTCDTLMIRNWITYQHVWSDKIIKCASPQIFKGQPWLQARQNDICISTTTERSKYNWDDVEYEGNDIMGDQPADINYDEEEDGGGLPGTHETPKGSDEDTEDAEKSKEKSDDDVTDDTDIFASPSPPSKSDDDEDEPDYNDGEDDTNDGLEKGFIPITSEAPVHSSSEVTEVEDNAHEEGSGADSSPPPIDAEINVDDDGGSGSGFGIPDSPTLGIFQDSTTTTTEEAILDPSLQSGRIKVESGAPSTGADPNELNKANVEDNTGTYILLFIIGILLVSLIVFVAIKNRQEKRNNKRRYDVEKNGATELQDMDKSLLGKPIDRNGNGKHEHSPLINDNHRPKDEGFIPYTTPAITVDEPIQEVPQKEKEKSQQSLYENGLPNGNGNVFEPIEPVHNTNGTVPKSPDSDDEVYHPAADNLSGPDSLEAPVDTPKRYSPIYTPISPRSARYSPVYSPETGRVKIKLTETPKPKTPVVVTRSRSRAGDYVNTPNN